MKRKISIIAISIFFFGLTNCSAQKITKDADGNYKQVRSTSSTVVVKQEAKKNGKTFTAADGEVRDVMVGPKGKEFVIRTSKKTGKEYKQYLTKAVQE